MILYLIRHAKSSWAVRGLSDHQRPLNERGRSDAPRMFERLLAHAQPPQLVVSSDAVRAASIAEILVDRLELAAERFVRDERLYHADAGRIAALARELPDSAPVAALVGHNPGMTHAANELAEDLRLDNLPTCGIVGIRFDVAHWSDLAAGTLHYFDYPKNADGPLIRSPESS